MELTVTNRSQAYPKGTMVSEFGKRIEKGKCQGNDFVCGFQDTGKRLRRNPESFFIYLPTYGILGEVKII